MANKHSERDFVNLVHSIRSANCSTPIVLIPFGGPPVTHTGALSQVQVLDEHDFPNEASEFVAELTETLKDCPRGFLRRFLAYFGPYEQFLYSDNDIVALSDWSELFQTLGNADLLNADMEHATEGRYNFSNPEHITSAFGPAALSQAVTAGHYLSRRSDKLLGDLSNACKWIRENQSVCKLHDQTLLHIAILLGKWDCINLCKEPYAWLSSWAGDYDSALEIIQQTQSGYRISHLHFSGFPSRQLIRSVDTLRVAFAPQQLRNRWHLVELLRHESGYAYLGRKMKRARSRIGSAVRQWSSSGRPTSDS